MVCTAPLEVLARRDNAGAFAYIVSSSKLNSIIQKFTSTAVITTEAAPATGCTTQLAHSSKHPDAPPPCVLALGDGFCPPTQRTGLRAQPNTRNNTPASRLQALSALDLANPYDQSGLEEAAY